MLNPRVSSLLKWHNSLKILSSMVPARVSITGMPLGILFLLLHLPYRPTKLVRCVEEHSGLGGNIIRRLDNGAFVGLIYSLLVLY